MAKNIGKIPRPIFKSSLRPSQVKGVRRANWNDRQRIVIRNLQLLSKCRNGDRWMSFVWDEYDTFVIDPHKYVDQGILETFVSTGLLIKDGDVYGFTQKFLDVCE